MQRWSHTEQTITNDLQTAVCLSGWCWPVIYINSLFSEVFHTWFFQGVIVVLSEDIDTWLQGGGTKAPLWLHSMDQGKEKERLEHPCWGSKCPQAAQRWAFALSRVDAQGQLAAFWSHPWSLCLGEPVKQEADRRLAKKLPLNLFKNPHKYLG